MAAGAQSDGAGSIEGFAATIDAGRLDTFLELAGAFVQEVRIELAEDGLRSEVVDPTNAASAYVELPAYEFDHYQADGGELGLAVETARDVVGLAGDEPVSLDLNPDTMKLDVAGENFEYAIAPINPDTMRKGAPDPAEITLDHAADLTLSPDQLKRIVDGGGMLDDKVEFQADHDAGHLAAVIDGDTDDLTFTFAADDLSGFDATDTVRTILSMEFLEPLSKRVAGRVHTQLGDQVPASFEFIRNGVSVEYLIAPRIDTGGV